MERLDVKNINGNTPLNRLNVTEQLHLVEKEVNHAIDIAAESSPVRTNWDVYCERYGTDKNEDLLKMAMFQGIGCRCCPAKLFCKKIKAPTCHDSFVRWAKSEAEEEK